MAETPNDRRTVSSGKAERMNRADNGTGPEIGSGKVLGSELTDTLGAELGYGIDGKTELSFFGKLYIFAPVSLEDQDEAASDLERLNTTLLAFGMVDPGLPASEVTPQHLAIMIRVLSGNADISELNACMNVALLFYNLTKEQRLALARLIWYSLRRWDDSIELTTVLRFLDYSNMPILLRLWFRKNIGVLDRFLHRLMELMPPANEINATDTLQTEQTISPQEFARLMSETGQEEEEAEATPEPEAQSEPEEAPLPATEEPTEQKPTLRFKRK